MASGPKASVGTILLGSLQDKFDLKAMGESLYLIKSAFLCLPLFKYDWNSRLSLKLSEIERIFCFTMYYE